MIKINILLTLVLCGLIFYAVNQKQLPSFSKQNEEVEEIVVARAEPKSFSIEVRTVGELEASRSTAIFSSIRGDLGKLIEIVQDGVYVNPGQLLVKIDPTPFEQKIAELANKVKEQEITIISLERTLDWEIKQAEHEKKTTAFEVESAELELNKIIKGDGPLEEHRLKSAMQKAKVKFEELDQYSNEIKKLEAEGFINASELKSTMRKLEDERQAYEDIKMQFDSYVNHVRPMQIKKAETALKKSKVHQEQSFRGGLHKIEMAKTALKQAAQVRDDIYKQIRDAQYELSLTEIYATTPGMVVHREEFRLTQKRKPRVGDVLVRNQPIMDIPDLTSMVVKTKVREVDLNKVEVGKPATIEVDAYPRQYFKGEVFAIGILALAELGKTNEEKYFEIRIGIGNSDQKLRPGMTTRVTIHSGVVVDKLAIPAQALFEHDKVACCYVKNGNHFNKQKIELGRNNEHWIEVVSGLKEGELVALSLPLKQTEKK